MPEELYYLLLFCVPVGIVIVLVCILCNISFWQGFRNSKFLDDVYKGVYDEEDCTTLEPTD